MADDLDLVFKALADPTRRLLLDRLHDDSGQTLGDLCAQLEMSRQAVSKHLNVLAAANLVVAVRRGREKLHYLNPEPIAAIAERWIDKYDRRKVQLLRDLKHALEEMTVDKPNFVYVTYIKTTADKVWQALTDGDITQRYWGGQQNVSDWKVGSAWRHEDADNPANVDGVGTVVESDRPHRLVVTWGLPADAGDLKHTRVTYDIAEDQGVVRLTVTEDPLNPTSGSSEGWPKVLAGLKSLLETGEPLPPFWERAHDGQWRMLRFA